MVHTGNDSAFAIGNAGTLSQTITTITGNNYDFSFWLSGDPASPNSFTASFGSDEVFDLVNPGGFSFTKDDFTVKATGTSTTIQFAAAAPGGFWSLDDVSVTDQGPATPEPANLVLLASGLLVIAWRSRHRMLR